MNMLYEKYKNLKIDGSWIGLELGGECRVLHTYWS